MCTARIEPQELPHKMIFRFPYRKAAAQFYQFWRRAIARSAEPSLCSYPVDFCLSDVQQDDCQHSDLDKEERNQPNDKDSSVLLAHTVREEKIKKWPR
jgi:hypothetical protein